MVQWLPTTFSMKLSLLSMSHQMLHDLVFVLFLNLIFHIVLVNIEQSNLQKHHVLSYTTIPPQITMNFSQLSGHPLTSPLPGPLYIFLPLPRKEILFTSLIPKPPLRHSSSKKLPSNKHSELCCDHQNTALSFCTGRACCSNQAP